MPIAGTINAADRTALQGESNSKPQVYMTAFDYSFAVSGDPGSLTTISKYAVPLGARVIGGWYEIQTTFTSANSTATLALQLVGANDLVTAIAINDASAPWTVDLTKRRPLKGITTQLAAAHNVGIISGVQAVTAGKLFGVVEWLLPDWDSTGH